MIDLGSVRLRHRGSYREVRQKVLRVVELLGADTIRATMLAASVSNLLRQVGTGSGAGLVGFSVQERPGGLRLELAFDVPGPLPGAAGLGASLGGLQRRRRGEQEQLVAGLDLPGTRPPTPELREAVAEVLRRKDRIELMSEVRARNEELRESLQMLRRTTSDKHRMESELNVGRDIQMSMIPQKFPPFPDRGEISVWATLVPAREVGGDLYDFFFLDRTHLCVCVGDVSGKGVPSALFMAVTRTLVKSLSKSSLSAATVMTQVNDELAQNNDSCMFVTLFLAYLDVSTGEMTYTNAGHNPPYLRRRDGTCERLDRRHGPVAGAMEGLAYRQDNVKLEAGDVLLLYTDGVTEAQNEAEQLYSEERLATLLAELPYDTTENLVGAVLEDVRDFEDGAQQADDITIVAVEYDGTEGVGIEVEEIRVPVSVAGLTQAQARVEQFCEARELSVKVISRLAVALDEVLNNIISYAFPDGPTGEIVVHLEHRDSGLVVTIEDEGVPFNPLTRPTPDTEADLEDRQIGGLGIHLVVKMMDEVHYERQGGRNVLTLKKNLQPPGGTEARNEGTKR
jgi:sigma-B regulation protein RsbU (phosphoserine phosphatase)